MRGLMVPKESPMIKTDHREHVKKQPLPGYRGVYLPCQHLGSRGRRTMRPCLERTRGIELSSGMLVFHAQGPGFHAQLWRPTNQKHKQTT